MATTRPPRIARSQLPEGASLCEYCTAKCCQYISVPITKPETWKDFDEVRWFVAHQDISVYVDDGSWYLLVNRVCKHLQPD
ncbi:MAG: YkgJ family cysteine cluster protein, partial [Planctomycetia bacterium]